MKLCHLSFATIWMNLEDITQNEIKSQGWRCGQALSSNPSRWGVWGRVRKERKKNQAQKDKHSFPCGI
jgi:hypothetical protein